MKLLLNTTFISIIFSLLLTTPSVAGDALTPIARWDTVPYQRINAGEVLNLSVVAFSKAGINRVEFYISGQGYNGGIKISRQMTLNSQTNVWEYWVPLSDSEFTSDGVINVEAVVYGNDGGVRNKNTGGGGLGLDALSFVVNHTGSLIQNTAWVSTTGNDATAAINNQNKPYLNIKTAAKAVGEGGIVYLTAGNYTASGGSSYAAANNEWITITAASGVSKDTVKIMANDVISSIQKAKVKGITFDASQISGQPQFLTIGSAPNPIAWIDDCNVIGNGQNIANSNPISTGLNKYLTLVHISYVDFATFYTLFVRNITIEHIGNDAFQNMPLIINAKIDDIDNNQGWHADLIGDTNPNTDNRIAYNVRGTNLHFQGIFDNTGATWSHTVEGQAFVNIYMELADPIKGSGGQSGYYFQTNHLLLWHVSMVSKRSIAYSHVFFFHSDSPPAQQTNMTNVSVIGSCFDYMGDGSGDSLLSIDKSDWIDNHYCLQAGTTLPGWGGASTPGTNFTTGNPGVDTYGKPVQGSILNNRVYPLVIPADADGNPRNTAGASIGAFEYQEGGIAGDITGPNGVPDGYVDIWDITACTKLILNSGYDSKADVVKNDTIDLYDRREIINIALKG